MITLEIKDKIRNWLHDKLEFSTFPADVIVLNFGIQKVYDGYELYQEGYDDYYEDHDTWMLSNIYKPVNNYFNLGISSLNITETEIFELYKSLVLSLILKSDRLDTIDLKYITITYFNGQPELLKRYL